MQSWININRCKTRVANFPANETKKKKFDNKMHLKERYSISKVSEDEKKFLCMYVSKYVCMHVYARTY